MPYIEIKKLTKKFKDLVAVNNFSMDINKGDIIGIVGPNGAGKTTLISMLNTRYIPTSGTAIISGFSLNQGHEIRKKIGVVFQETVLNLESSPYLNLKYLGMLYKVEKKILEKRINSLIELVGLTKEKDKEVSKFSGGMKRRVEIAMGLLTNPEILFLDEPTLGLDPMSRNKIWNYIKKANKEHNMTIIVNTNYMQEAEELCNKIAIMQKGKLIVYDTITNLKNSLKGDVIDLKVDNLTKANTFFNKQKWVKESEEYNKTLRLFVQNGENKIERIIDSLKKEKIKLKSITFRKPSMDDVFLHYCGEKLE